MAYEPDRVPGSPSDPRQPAAKVERPGGANTGIIVVILAIVALFLGIMFFSGGPEQAVVPDATLPTTSQSAPPTTGAPSATPTPDVTPAAPATPGAAPVTPAPAN